LKKEIAAYKIRPDLDDKFRPGAVQVIIEKIVRSHLEGQVYNGEEMAGTAKVISTEIHEKMKAQKYRRYKVITFVTLGERRGEGVSSATRCVWDSESDCLATYTFLNVRSFILLIFERTKRDVIDGMIRLGIFQETMFCCTTVYGVYYY
jgi:hypothetical protein